MPTTAEPFGTLTGGAEATLHTLVNARGSRMRVTDYGGIVTALEVPDRDGRRADVVLGFDTLDGYTSDLYRDASPYFGAIIGRYGNRIAHGRFELDDATYQLATNDGAHHLHGGDAGFDKRLWEAEAFETDEGVGLHLRRTSADGEEGYPGKLNVAVTYLLTHDDRLAIDYAATTDAPTVLNLTHHSYFNLTGDPSRDVLGHELQLRADAFTPIGEAGPIPTGELRPVDDTPFDFRAPTPLGARLDDDSEQLARAQGYDHNLVLDHDGFAEAARVYEPTTGRVLLVETTEPGVQLYTGNFLDGRLTGKRGIVYEQYAGFCLETQHVPDAPNQPVFPSTVLRPGETYRSRTVYTFRTRS